METKDTRSAIRLLRMWHDWAAQYTDAPQEVRCLHCNHLLGAVYEPDAMRLPGPPLGYSDEQHAYLADGKFYRHEPSINDIQQHVTRSKRTKFGYKMPRHPHDYRLPLAVAIVCDKCNNVSVIERPPWPRLNEMRKVVRRLGDDERAAVEAAYGALCETAGSRKLPLDVDDDWPFSTPERAIGQLPADEVSRYFREDESPSRAQYPHVSAKVAGVRSIWYTNGNSQDVGANKGPNVRGGYHRL